MHAEGEKGLRMRGNQHRADMQTDVDASDAADRNNLGT